MNDTISQKTCGHYGLLNVLPTQITFTFKQVHKYNGKDAYARQLKKENAGQFNSCRKWFEIKFHKKVCMYIQCLWKMNSSKDW